MTRSARITAALAGCALVIAARGDEIRPAQPTTISAVVERTIRLYEHPDSLLQGVSDVAPGPDGRLVVVDNLARNVKVYLRSGALGAIIGRRGAGPGEFGVIQDVEALPDGRILVVEASRVQIFSLTGSLLSQYRTLGALVEAPLGYAASTDGTLHAATIRRPPAGARAASPAGGASGAGGRRNQPIPSGDFIRVSSSRSMSDTSTLFLETGSPPVVPVQLGPRPLWSRNRAGTMLVSMGASPRFRLYSPRGALIREVTIPSQARELPERDIAVLVAKAAESIPPAIRPMVLDGMREQGFADRYPAHVAILITDDEHIWAQLPATAADIRSGRVRAYDPKTNAGAPEWLVLSSQGASIARVVIPMGFHLRAVCGERLYGDAQNEQGEPVVQVLRLNGWRSVRTTAAVDCP